VQAYHLACKEAPTSWLGLDLTDDTLAASELYAIRDLGADAFTGGKPLFCPVNRVSIFSPILDELPDRKKITLVMPYEIDLTDPYFLRMHTLRQLGYRLAFSGVAFHDEHRLRALLLQTENCMIADYHYTNQQTWGYIRRNSDQLDLIFKNLKTVDQFDMARRVDGNLFMGKFYTLPFSQENRKMAPLHMTVMRLLRLASDDTYPIDELSQIISLDTSLSFDLLRLINSAAFGFRNEIANIKSAIIAMGQKEFRKWVSYSCVKALSVNTPTEVMRCSLIRAHFCQNLASGVGEEARAQDYFLVGLFSILDAVLGRPMSDVLNEIAVSGAIKQALSAGEGPYADILRAVLDYEAGDWTEVAKFLIMHEHRPNVIADAYFAALRWYNQLVSEIPVTIT
jgi:EAL and modified HD-GYP domain-containing signal transduction protein